MSKRMIEDIIIHCSASGPHTTRDDIKRWHKDRGWSDIGYHYVIENDGGLKLGRNIDKKGAHCKGHNMYSIGICLVGGIDGRGTMHKFNKKQYEALRDLIDSLRQTYGNIPIYPHNKFNRFKTCPCFDIYEVLDEEEVK